MNKQLFINAATSISNGYLWYCCTTLESLSSEKNPEELQFFKEIFFPVNSYSVFWWDQDITEESQLARSLALLLAAEMCNEME